MLLGCHYLSFYHVFYGINQWLANQGYVVLSVNFRSGIGYGRAFRTGAGHRRARQLRVSGRARRGQVARGACRTSMPTASASGACRTAACSPRRRSRATPTSSRPASISPACTSRGSSLDPENLAYRSSAISEIDKWKSPVLLVHGDDDRNVNFAQTVGLVQLLRARNVYHELIVFPDDIHETLLHSRWLYTFDRMEAFLNKFLGETAGGESMMFGGL